MRLNKALICAALSLLLLTGCAKAPSEVDKEIENYNSAQTVKETVTDTLPVSEALEQARRFGADNTTNITVKNLILPESTKMPTYDVRFDSSGAGDVFKKLQSEPIFANDGGGIAVDSQNDIHGWKDKKENCFSSYPELNGTLYYRNKSDVKRSDWGTYYNQDMGMNESGIMTLFANERKTGIGSALKYTVEKRYLTGFSESTESFALCDGKKMSVGDAVKFAQKFCNDKLAAMEKNIFEYQVNYLDARKVADGKYGYYVSLCRKDRYGNLFDATSMYPYIYDEFESRNAFIASPMYLWITSQDNIAEFQRMYTFSIAESGTNDKIVTLKTAVNVLSSELAQGKSYDFDTAELKYIFEITQSDYIDAAREYAKSGAAGDIPIIYSPESVYAYGGYKITAKPYWVFTEIVPQNTETTCGRIFMVDALDASLRTENVDEHGRLLIQY